MKCRRCGKEISNPIPILRGYCSYRCRETKERVCVICSKKFMGTGKTCSKECTNKLREQTNLKKYGTTNVSSSNKVKQKRKQTNLDRYGVEYIGQSEEKRERRKETCLRKYGVDNPSKVQYVKEKAKETSLERYGIEHYSKLRNVRDSKSTVMKEMWNDRDFVDKYKKTVNQLYGTDNLFASKHVIEKRKQNNIEKYGVDNNFKRPEIKEQIKRSLQSHYGVDNPMKSTYIVNKVVETNLERYGVPFHCMTDVCRNSQGNTISKINERFAKLLDIHEFEFSIGRFSYDLKKDDTLIEVNPTYTHNSTLAPYFKGHEGKPLTRDYHINKTKFALDNGYRCIQIFDWDDVDKIKYLIKDKETLYARNLTLKEVSKDECDNFLNNNHLQNTCKGQDIRLGLYKDDKLVQLMTFGTPRYNKKFQYELLRLCTDKDYKVVGGSNKLFKYFIDSYNPLSIISYCDNGKFSGDVYKSLNFTLKTFGTPSCHWFNLKTGRHITDNLLRARGFSQLHGDNNYKIASKGDSNKELMIKNGYVEVYDCGQSTYMWYKES